MNRVRQSFQMLFLETLFAFFGTKPVWFNEKIVVLKMIRHIHVNINILVRIFLASESFTVSVIFYWKCSQEMKQLWQFTSPPLWAPLYDRSDRRPNSDF